ncbi:MAG: hypothetical protein ACFFAY_00815 [Promethearchaeota archaeon]
MAPVAFMRQSGIDVRMDIMESFVTVRATLRFLADLQNYLEGHLIREILGAGIDKTEVIRRK